MTQTDQILTFSNSLGFGLRGVWEAQKQILSEIGGGREKSEFDKEGLWT